MNDLERFQTLQRALVDAGFASTLEARRERNEAVFSLTVAIDEQDPAQMALLAELTTDNGFAFTVDGKHASITTLEG
jgi:hypothetical protein